MKPVYMIAMSNHPISQMYVREFMGSWKDHGITPKLHEATTPKDLVYRNQLTFGIKTKGREQRPFTSTEKSVWYSHFDLWCKCVREGSLTIVEHDSKLMKPLPDMTKEGYKFLSYSSEYNTMAVGSGYYLTPAVAERLVANAVSREININSDGFIADTLNSRAQQKMKDYFYINQICFDGLNTIDHKSPKRTYVGLDYNSKPIYRIR
jgi:GR25 family glycosyltransferase involved in LPS biosynthesis|tara:strand:- start:920 stop:1540 length:621 start_codon:yes stop_codon:yes gene_type:complete